MKIFNRKIPEKNIRSVVDKIKSKKELENFSDEYTQKLIEYFLKRNPKILSEMIYVLDQKKIKNNKNIQLLVKNVRDRIRRVYGMYITKDYSKKEKILEKNNSEELSRILRLHTSSKERISHYSKIYEKIIEITGEPESIIDLGCGLNPFSINYIYNINKKKLKYYASDISPEDIKFIDKFIKENKHFKKGSKAFPLDLTDEKNIEIIKKYETDWCFLLKLLDPIEEVNEGITYKIIPEIRSKYIIASFPTETISRKNMRNPRRSWFEKVLIRNNLFYETFEEGKELFYIIKNK
ncbi:MAG: hypothetical protein ACQER9_02160 [Nanobdellota archaeon]